MEALLIRATEESPGINFDKESNKFLIFGKSFPEEARRFFDPAILWLDEYAKKPNQETIFEVRLEYYNSATSTILLEMLHIINKIYVKGSKAKIVWNYLEIDDDMLEAGKEYSEMLKVPFEFRAIEDFE